MAHSSVQSPARFPLRGYLQFARRYIRHVVEGRRHRVPIIPAAHRPDPCSWPNDRLTVAWLSHATVLMNFHGTWLITDPALADRIGIRLAGLTLGPRRLTAPALRPQDLPELDLILVSHAHMDHLDLGTLRRFPRRTRVITHRGVADLLRYFDQVDEIGWNEKLEHDGLTIEGTAARHWGARTIRDHTRGFGGFLLSKAGRTVLFAGDTAYTDGFAAYTERSLDLAILPIGAYDPWIRNHANPEEAWLMGRQMNARHVMPVHHSTFRLSREPMAEPIERFLKAAGDEEWRVVTRKIGETWAL
jgi:L-ascorbate metabolism protein UlaG (beta-lactamase superfamily)